MLKNHRPISHKMGSFLREAFFLLVNIVNNKSCIYKYISVTYNTKYQIIVSIRKAVYLYERNNEISAKSKTDFMNMKWLDTIQHLLYFGIVAL